MKYYNARKKRGKKYVATRTALTDMSEDKTMPEPHNLEKSSTAQESAISTYNQKFSMVEDEITEIYIHDLEDKITKLYILETQDYNVKQYLANTDKDKVMELWNKIFEKSEMANNQITDLKHNNSNSRSDSQSAANVLSQQSNPGKKAFINDESRHFHQRFTKKMFRNAAIKEMTDIMKSKYRFFCCNSVLLLWDNTYYPMPFDRFSELCRRELLKKYGYLSDNIIDKIYKILIADQPQIADLEFDRFSHYITFLDGYYDVRNKQLIQIFDPNIYTMGTLPVSYVACSSRHNEEPHYFTNYLSRISNDDPNMIKYMYEKIGYWISNFYHLKTCDILVGQEDYSKSTSVFVELIRQLVGNNFVSSVSLNELGNKFKRAEIYGMKLNTNTDISDMTLNNDGIFKMFTGGGHDRISAAFKHKNPFNFTSRAKHIYCTNDLKSVNIKNIDTDAVRNRINVIRFDGKIDAREFDDNVMLNYYLEREGIIWRSLGALIELYENNFIFTQCEQVNVANREFDGIIDPILGKLRQFINAYCYIHHQSSIYVNDFVEIFNNVMRENITVDNFSKNYRGCLMSEYGFTKAKKRLYTTNPKSTLIGIDIRHDMFNHNQNHSLYSVN